MYSTDPKYPRSGSLADDLFRHRMDRLHVRFEGLDRVPTGGDFDRLNDFVTIHESLLENGRIHEGESRFRPVPARRYFGLFRWFDPERRVVVGAHWPPFKPSAASVALAFPLPPEESPLERLDLLGFPPPDRDPTIVFGEISRPEGATLVYAPGPRGLAELVYRLRRRPEGWDVIVTAERPPEPRYGELVDQLWQAFGWTGTLSFPTGEAFRHKNGELRPPGTYRLQQVA